MADLSYFKLFLVSLCVGLELQYAVANCVLSMKTDLSYNQPLILSALSGDWYSLSNARPGALQISRDETVKLVCPNSPSQPNSFANFPSKNELIAKCQSATGFEIDKKTYSFDKLQCKLPVKPTTKRNGQQCQGSDSELIKVGYETSSSFVAAYEVCFDKSRLGTLYSEVLITPDIEKNDAPIREGTWVSDQSVYGNINLDAAYSCPKQAESFKTILNKKYFDDDEKCCLEKTQLVNAADLALAPQQLSTFHYLNTVPQWSTCNRANWKEVQNRIRTLGKNLQRPLHVWSGTFRSMKLAAKWGIFYKDMFVHYTGKNDKALPVPLYIWKVVFDPQTQKAVAIIEVNNPKMTLNDVEGYVLCDDICDNVNWMNFLARKTISSGYMYCCDLNSFEFSFQFKKSPFPKASGGILRDDTRVKW